MLEALDFDLFCRLIGLLWLLDLLAYLPIFTPFFGGLEKQGFRGGSRRRVGLLQGGWLLSALALIFGDRYFKLAGTLFFYVLFRHFYIDTRWSSVRRGGGAPGFMSHWTAFYLLLLQLAAFSDASGWLAGRVHWMMQVDFAVIMICAGTYKYMVGYMHHDGMEYGRVNPLWGYYWEHFRVQSPHSLYIRLTNFLAFSVEIVAGILMLVPQWRWLGALAISLSFLYVAAYIRLGRLAFLMAVLPMLYASAFGPGLISETPRHWQLPEPLLLALGVLPVVFVALLPLVKIHQYRTLFANQPLPEPWQKWISTYANQVPIIMWRVFTPDVTNFYVRIYADDPRSGASTILCDEATLSYRRWNDLNLKLRFWHVTEAIAIVSVFTTLKYFPSNRRLFEEKLITYSQSLEWSLKFPVERFRYEYVSIAKGDREFVFRHVGTFTVDMNGHQVSEEKHDPEFDFSAPSRFSPVRESLAPGSFTPMVLR